MLKEALLNTTAAITVYAIIRIHICEYKMRRSSKKINAILNALTAEKEKGNE